MTIDRALSGDPFSIDSFRCHDAAQQLRAFSPQMIEEPWSSLPTSSQVIFKILFISICHQFNWDFLQGAMAKWLLPDPEAKLNVLTDVRAPDIQSLLDAYPRPERIRAKERAQMLRTTAKEVLWLVNSGLLSGLVASPKLDGSTGFYELMRNLSAYAEDELEKKVRVLAHDLYREQILRFSDPENLRPAVEYHLIRLYLRSGRVYPTHDSIREQLSGESTPARHRLVKLLRLKVAEAMSLTSFYAGIDVATLNYIEWQIGRSICRSELPRCTDSTLESVPSDIARLSPDQCPYASFCRAHTEPQYGWYQEPHFQKAIY